MIRRACTFCTVSTEPSLIALKRRDVDRGSGQFVYTSSCDLGTYRICEQQMIWRACTFAQSRQSLRWLHYKDGCRWRLRPNCLYQFMWFRYISHMRAANDLASLHILHSLARAIADCTIKIGCRWRLRPNCLYQFMWFGYLSHMRAANDQASLHILHSLARAFPDCT